MYGLWTSAGEKNMGNFTQPRIGPFSVAALIATLGAVIGIVALFLNWYDWPDSRFFKVLSEQITGIGFLTENTDAFQKFCPLISCIIMVISLIVTILPIFKVKLMSEDRTYLVTIALGVLSLAVVIVFLSWTDHASIGAYMGLVASILVLLGGALPMVEELE